MATPAAATTDHEPLIDVSGLAPERANVRIRIQSDPDGSLYELKRLEEFGIADQQALMQDGQTFDKLFNADVLNSNERKRLKQVLDRMFDRVLIADAKIKAECNDHVRSQVVTAFTVAPLVMAARDEQAQEETPETEEEATAGTPSTTET